MKVDFLLNHFQLFRFVNRKTEETLAEIMTKNLSLTPEDMGIKLKFLPTATGHSSPFVPAVMELCKLSTLVCPLSKLECIGEQKLVFQLFRLIFILYPKKKVSCLLI